MGPKTKPRAKARRNGECAAVARKAVVLLGPPGAGKGTQAKIIEEKLGLARISTGDILRDAVRRGTPLGLAAKRHMDEGRLVPDEVMIGIIRERTARADCSPGFVLDGFPRTIPQAESLDGILAEEGIELYAIVIKISDEMVGRRLAGRRSCPDCGRIYNIHQSPSARGEFCEACGGQLEQRSDDSEQVVAGRLAVYHTQTEPLVSYYRRRGRLYEVNGERPVEEISRDILNILGRKEENRSRE